MAKRKRGRKKKDENLEIKKWTSRHTHVVNTLARFNVVTLENLKKSTIVAGKEMKDDSLEIMHKKGYFTIEKIEINGKIEEIAVASKATVKEVRKIDSSTTKCIYNSSSLSHDLEHSNFIFDMFEISDIQKYYRSEKELASMSRDELTSKIKEKDKFQQEQENLFKKLSDEYFELRRKEYLLESEKDRLLELINIVSYYLGYDNEQMNYIRERIESRETYSEEVKELRLKEEDEYFELTRKPYLLSEDRDKLLDFVDTVEAKMLDYDLEEIEYAKQSLLDKKVYTQEEIDILKKNRDDYNDLISKQYLLPEEKERLLEVAEDFLYEFYNDREDVESEMQSIRERLTYTQEEIKTINSNLNEYFDFVKRRQERLLTEEEQKRALELLDEVAYQLDYDRKDIKFNKDWFLNQQEDFVYLQDKDDNFNDFDVSVGISTTDGGFIFDDGRENIFIETASQHYTKEQRNSHRNYAREYNARFIENRVRIPKKSK